MLQCGLISATTENGTPRKPDLTAAGQKKIQTNVRLLRGHTGAVTALHCVTRREVCDLYGDREDAGFFISGSTDCSVSFWFTIFFLFLLLSDSCNFLYGWGLTWDLVFIVIIHSSYGRKVELVYLYWFLHFSMHQNSNPIHELL